MEALRYTRASFLKIEAGVALLDIGTGKDGLEGDQGGGVGGVGAG